LFESVEQDRVVAGVEADGGLVEDVADTTQIRAELRRQANALAFATGQGVRAAVQPEIAEPDLLEEEEARSDLTQRSLHDRAVSCAEAKPGDGTCRLADREAGEVGEPEALDADRAGARVQSRARAGGARLLQGEVLESGGVVRQRRTQCRGRAL